MNLNTLFYYLEILNIKKLLQTSLDAIIQELLLKPTDREKIRQQTEVIKK